MDTLRFTMILAAAFAKETLLAYFVCHIEDQTRTS